MLPELLKNIDEVRDIRVKNLLAFTLDGNIAVITRQKIKEILRTLDLNIIKKGLEKLKDEGIVADYFIDDGNSFKVEVAQDKVLDFMELKAFYTDEAEMKKVNLISAVSFIRFWFLIKESNYDDFRVTADELSIYLKIKKYQLAQTATRDKKSFFDRLVDNMNKAGIYIRYEFVNGKNIRYGIRFVLYKDKGVCSSEEAEAIINKIKLLYLGKHVDTDEKKRKTILANKLIDVFGNKREFPVYKKIIKNLTLKENELLLYSLMNYISSKRLEK